MFEKIEFWYKNGFWSIDRVWNVVGKEKGITEAEYTQITGFVYPEKA